MSSYNDLSDDSRIWIYQSDRELQSGEVEEIRSKGRAFTQEWAAHGTSLTAEMEVFYNRFIVLFADETNAGASGCSIDSSVHFIQKLEQDYGVNLMDRLQLAYREGGNIIIKRMADFEEKVAKGDITEDTIVFNNLVRTKKEFIEGWEVPVKNSWHHRMLPIPQQS